MQNIAKLLREHAKTLTRKLNEAADLLDGGLITPKPKRRFHRIAFRAPVAVRKPMSKASRLKISRAQKARWKLYHGGKKAA